MHQDIAARNLLIDDKENLCIFDFNYSIMIQEHYEPKRDDLRGVILTLYEIITLDEHFRDLPHAEQDVEALLRLEWVKHPDVKLDSDVLDTWVAIRRRREFKLVDTSIQWPIPMPHAPPAPVPVKGPDGAITGIEMKSVPVLFRPQLVQMKEPYFEWERPASYRLKDVLEKKGS